MGKQSKTKSFVETCVSITFGFTISCSMFYWLLPWWGYSYTAIQSVEVTTLFTLTSFARLYLVRRFFEKYI